MNLNCETILDFYTHNNKKVLCQIKVTSSKSRKFKNNTCRCLGQEQWNTFDRELEKLITANDEWNDEKCLDFKIKPHIEVKVQKSKLSLKHFYKCLGANDDCEKDELGDGGVVEDIIEASYVLECVLNFQNTPVDVTHQLEGQPLIETTTDILSIPLSYEPYTPSNKRYRADNIDTVKTPGIDFLEYNENSNSPKRNTLETSESEQPQLSEIISNNTSEPTENCQSSDEVIIETGDEIDSPKKSRFKKSKRLETEYTSKSKEIPVTGLPVHRIEEESSDRKVTETDYDIKKHRKRTKTLDTLPELLDNNSKEKHKSKKERSSSRDRHSHYDNKILKKRSKTIDEIPVGLSENIEKSKLKNLTDESKEKSRKKLQSTDKHKSHKSEVIKEKPYTTSDSTDKHKSHKSEDIKEKAHKKLDPTDKSASHKSEERKEKPYKKLDSSDKSTTHKAKEKKKDVKENISSTKEKVTNLEKKHVRRSTSSSSEDEFLEALVEAKKVLKTAEKVSDDEFEDHNKLEKKTKLSQANDNTSSLNISISSATESNTDTSPCKVRKRVRKPKEISPDVNKSLRRSERSPSKPIRFIEEQPNLLKSKKPKTAKTSPKNKELFGTDDDDEENYFEKNSTKTNSDNKVKSSIFETPVSKKSVKSASSSSSSSTKKKRKRDKSSECEQEKRAMGNWLGKKKSSSDIEEKKASTSKSSSSKSRPLKTTKKEKTEKNEVDAETHAKTVTPTPSFELPSKEEMELIRNKTKLTQKENAILKAELDKMRTSPPKEVEFKSLQDVPAEEILNTFSIYQTELDEIYKNNYKRDYIKGHEGINHCFVIRLLPQNIQMKMLEKLTDVYSNTKSSTQATLFANALLPEWVIRVYMEKFKFNRQEAMHQIKAQEEFRLHMEEQNDNSFMFD
ncbi:uncharacterized protein DDB_G0284459 [Lucilia sericata]|uniref:uncharacterized protein DDB_G0284459 n=1 Tax=Lucilia sericata TaxID=13632 RepID=UPI0018A81753|nr:uncharacterized protein DDB_G0284459 [Lucilia sericata]